MHPGAPGKGVRSTGVAEWSGTRLEDTKPEGPESSDPVGRFPTAGQDDKMESFKEAAADLNMTQSIAAYGSFNVKYR